MAKNKAAKPKAAHKKSAKGGSGGKLSRASAVVTLVLLILFVVFYVGRNVVERPSVADVTVENETPSQPSQGKSAKSVKKEKKPAKRTEKSAKKETPSAKNTAKTKSKPKKVGALANVNPERDLLPKIIAKKTSQVIRHQGYVVSYNADYKVPNWVLYELNMAETLGDLERKNNFAVDPEVPEKQMAQLADYRNSGYDRGHMAPNADMNWSQQAQDESFYLSNMCPQGHDFNAGIWLDLENQVRAWAERDSAVTIVCGPVLPRSSADAKRMKRIGKGKVLVPELFWKVVLVPFAGEARAIGFVMPNHNEKIGRKNRPLTDYAVTVDSVERLTGLDFFPALADDIEEEIESNYNLKSWF